MIPNQVTRAAACKLLAGCALLALAALNAHAQQTTGVSGAPGATTTITGKQIPPPDGIRRCDQRKGFGLEALVAAAHRAAERRTQRAAHYDGRPGFRCAKHVRWRHTHPCHGPHCKSRAALHELPFNVAVLAAEPR